MTEQLIGGLVTFVCLLLAVFGIGHQRGKSAAERRQAADDAAAATAAMEKRLEAVKNAENARQNVDGLSDADVDQRLRERWTRPGSD